MGDRAAKDALYEGFAAVTKALANGRRVEVLDLLAQGERSVEELWRAVRDVAELEEIDPDELVARLGTTRRGYKARRLEDGYPEWKRAGLPSTSARTTPPAPHHREPATSIRRIRAVRSARSSCDQLRLPFQASLCPARVSDRPRSDEAHGRYSLTQRVLPSVPEILLVGVPTRHYAATAAIPHCRE